MTTFASSEHSPSQSTKEPCYNPTDRRLETNGATYKFIRAMAHEVWKGYGFIPFIGAGFSAPSGVPLINELTLYLNRCIGLALGLEDKGMRPPWNPRTDQWPAVEEGRRGPVEDWFGEVRAEHERLQLIDRWSPEVRIFQEAMGAMADWRTCLLFLSRIKWESSQSGRLILDAPDHDVVDSFFRSIIDGKKPSLGHNMLANIAVMMRIDLIVTTNFDDLVESAFTTTQVPLIPFDVHLQTGLPPWSALATQRSIVKLHGSRHSLRADYSVDALPSETDLRTFLDYFLSSTGRAKRQGSSTENFGAADLRHHLLIAGVGATENRSKAFIKYLWEHLPLEFNIFWLCHSTKDVKNISDFHEELLRLRNDKSVPAAPTLHVLRHTNHGLFLLHAYQYLRRGLPPKRIIYPLVSRLATPPMRLYSPEESAGGDGQSPMSSNPRSSAGQSALQTDSAHAATAGLAAQAAKPPAGGITSPQSDETGRIQRENQKALEKLREEERANIVARLRKAISYVQAKRYPHPKLIVLTSAQAQGLMSAAGEMFEELQANGQIAIWLDMNDVSSSDDLFEQLIDAAHYRIGEDRWMPVFLEKDLRPRLEEIRRLTDATRDPWIVFLNARETPGANQEEGLAEAEKADRLKHPNGWLDYETPRKSDAEGDNDSAYVKAFVNLLVELCGASSPHLTVVLLCRQKRNDNKDARLFEELKNLKLVTESGDTLISVDKDCTPYPTNPIVANVIKWIATGRIDGQTNNTEGTPADRGRFVHALVLMQRARYLASLWQPAFRGLAADNGSQTTLDWLSRLEATGFVRWKLGGFIWLHSGTRNLLREIFHDPRDWKSRLQNRIKPDPHGAGIDDDSLNKLAGWSPQEKAAEIQWELALWYQRVALAAQVPQAVFEAMYHACLSATHLCPSQPSPMDLRRMVERVKWATALLHAFTFLVQTSGYSRNSCRRLTYLSETIAGKIIEVIGVTNDPDRQKVRNAVRMFRIRCTEAMRNVAREVAEDRKAYIRHRQVRKLLCERDIDSQDPGEHDWFWKHVESKVKDEPWLLYEWFRWGRWSAMLGIASRSYAPAEETLRKRCDSINPQVAPTQPDFFAPLLSEKPMIRGLPCDDVQLQVLRIEVARCLEQYAFLSLLQGSMFARRIAHRDRVQEQALSEDKKKGDSPSSRKLLSILPNELPPEYFSLLAIEKPRNWDKKKHVSPEEAKASIKKAIDKEQKADTENMDECIKRTGALVSTGLRLVDVALGCDESLDSFHHVPLMWVRSRLLMHNSIVELRNAAADPDIAAATALRTLSDAEACLNISDARRDNTDLALIELHRAEVCLYAAGRVKLLQQPETTFDQHCRQLANEMATTVGWRNKDGADAQYEHRFGKHASEFKNNVAKVQARVADSMRFLDRAGRVLRSRRCNVWWATWYFQRRLGAVAMAVWATVGENEGTPIPFLGLEAAVRTSKTLADRLLDDALRMVRFDSYRLATIVDAYADTALALQMRLVFDRTAGRLPHRQMDMCTRLRKAVERLQQVKERRARPEGMKSKEVLKSELSLEVASYIQGVIELTKHRLEVLKYPVE